MKVWAKTEQFKEGKFLVVRRDGTIPPWPHFVLGGRDPAAPAALRAYASTMAQRPGTFDHQGNFTPAKIDQEYISSVLELADDFDAYRAANGDGDPEAAPHRTDDPAVIAAMRHQPSTILVRPSNQPEPPAFTRKAASNPDLGDAIEALALVASRPRTCATSDCRHLPDHLACSPCLASRALGRIQARD